ncbi:PIN-like domain-containing protein [Actinomadura keratinilytica]
MLDTNVLLSLYEYTETSRKEVLSALEQTAGRLWMPYQVGLEFVRGRRSTLESRKGLSLMLPQRSTRSSWQPAKRSSRRRRSCVRSSTSTPGPSRR